MPDYLPYQLLHNLRSLFDDILWCCVRIYVSDPHPALRSARD